MKRFIALLLALLMALFEAAADVMVAGAQADGDYEYILTEKGAQIVYFNGNASIKELHIPDTLGGRAVTGIGWGAFGSLHKLREVDIPHSVLSISDEAFLNCTSLETVHIGSGVLAMDGNPFDGCVKLTKITLSEQNEAFTLIDGALFAKEGLRLVCWPGGKKQAEYLLPAGATAIGDGAFCGSPHLRKVVIPQSVTSIHSTAFNDGYGKRMAVELDIRGNQYARAYAEKNGMAYTYELSEEEVRQQTYQRAAQLYAQGSFEQAQAIFEQLGGYADSAQQVKACIYGRADAAYLTGDYQTAESLFASIIGYADAQDRRDESVFRQFRVGTHLLFGRLEQDDDLSNGADPIEWIVLDRQGDEVLVISKDLLIAPNADNFPGGERTDYPYMYNAGFDSTHRSIPTTWENSIARKSLNTRFLSEAFTQQEREAIVLTTLKAEARPFKYASKKAGSDTQDRVFMLSYQQVMDYLPNAEDRVSQHTQTNLNRMTYWQREDLSTQWLLRHPTVNGDTEAAGIDGNGEFTDTANRSSAIRPACCIDLSLAWDMISRVVEEEPIAQWNVGDQLLLGSYEQDNNLQNGAEPIEWLVIAREGNKALLLSRHVLAAMRFDRAAKMTWDKSSIRAWLNETFLPQAFSADEKSVLARRTAAAMRAAEGQHTQDYVFLLSSEQLQQCLPDTITRAARPTAYASAQDLSQVDYEAACWWWLRSSGKGVRHAHAVEEDGTIVNRSFDSTTNIGVRPAIWVNLDSIDK